jgi:hypothetical protein
MASDFGCSINETKQKLLTLREATCDFLTKANLIIQKKSIPFAHSYLNRYYRLEVNSYIDPDEHDIDLIIKLSRQSVTCLTCGNQKSLKIKRRQQLNRSKSRKHCRQLKGLLIVECKTCKHKETYKFKRRKSILNAIGELKTSKDQHRSKISDPVKSSEQSPAERIINLPKKKRKLKVEVQAKAPATQTKKPLKQIVKRKVKNPQQKPPETTTNQKAPQFSSRLRAFTCLLKQ